MVVGAIGGGGGNASPSGLGRKNECMLKLLKSREAGRIDVVYFTSMFIDQSSSLLWG
jgi:hypothetical protein